MVSRGCSVKGHEARCCSGRYQLCDPRRGLNLSSLSFLICKVGVLLHHMSQDC